MTASQDLGLIGLGVMGQNLALNIADHGFSLAVFNRTVATAQAFAAAAEPGQKIQAAAELKALVAALKRPRAVITMLPAGAATDEALDALAALLEPGDVLIDCGNALYADTMRRERALTARGLGFVGAGVSGGEEGARHGPSIMAGGSADAVARIAPVFEAIAAKAEGAACYAHVGPDGAGHFVKMLHNGIEYADMQLIAETYDLMRRVLGLDHGAMQAAFAQWNRGELDSYLIEITAAVLGRIDPETGAPLVEQILDRAGQKGTGGWAVAAALELGVAAPTIAAAVEARTLSAIKAERERAAKLLSGPAPALADGAGLALDDLAEALLLAKIGAYAQGFAVIDAAGRRHGWTLDRARIAAIWRAGCIIRARLLGQIMAAYERAPDLVNLMLDPAFAARIGRGQGAWRRVVAAAVGHGVPAPGLGSALAYYDSYRAARLPANLIQAQRDFFGAHTYERIDRPGSVHTDWTS
jgi:6-phosphogluconate dehydrogenase